MDYLAYPVAAGIYGTITVLSILSAVTTTAVTKYIVLVSALAGGASLATALYFYRNEQS